MTRARFSKLVTIVGTLALLILFAVGLLLWRPDEPADDDEYAICRDCGLNRDVTGQVKTDHRRAG